MNQEKTMDCVVLLGHALIPVAYENDEYLCKKILELRNENSALPLVQIKDSLTLKPNGFAILWFGEWKYSQEVEQGLAPVAVADLILEQLRTLLGT